MLSTAATVLLLTGHPQPQSLVFMLTHLNLLRWLVQVHHDQLTIGGASKAMHKAGTQWVSGGEMKPRVAQTSRHGASQNLERVEC